MDEKASSADPMMGPLLKPKPLTNSSLQLTFNSNQMPVRSGLRNSV